MATGRGPLVQLMFHPTATSAELIKYEKSWIVWFVTPQGSEPEIIWWEDLGTDLADDHARVETIVGYIEQKLQAAGHRVTRLGTNDNPDTAATWDISLEG